MTRFTRTDVPVTPASETSAWLRWQMVALLVAYSFMTWFNRVSMSVAYDESIHAEYGIAPEQMGWVYSAFLFAYMLCMTPGGWLIDTYGPWAALVVMGFGSALFGSLTALAGWPVLAAGGGALIMLIVIRSIMGALTAPVYPASSRVVANWLPAAQRARANGMVQGAAAVGITCAFPLFGTLIDLVAWPTAFVISGACTALVALLWTVLGANRPSGSRAPMPTDLVQEPPVASVRRERFDHAAPPLWRHRSLILLTLTYAAIGYVEYLFFFWMHYYFEDILHLGKDASRLYAAILTLAMAAGMVLGGWIADHLRVSMPGRLGAALVPVGGMCVGAVMLILGVRAQETVWIVALLAVALGAVGATEAPVWTMATEVGGKRGGTAAAICNTGGNAGGLVAPIVTPWVSGWVTRHFELSEIAGWQFAISLGSVVAIAGAVLWIWITPPGNHEHDAAR